MCMMILGAADRLWWMKIWCVQSKRRLGRTDDSPLRHFPCIFPQILRSLLNKIFVWCQRSRYHLLCIAGGTHSTVEGYKNWCNAVTGASTIVETMSKSSVRCVHQMAIYRVIQEESALLREMIVWVILRKKLHMNMGPILNGYGVMTVWNLE